MPPAPTATRKPRSPFRRPAASPKSFTSIGCWKTRKLAANYQILAIPGGFSYGDDISAGRIFGNQMRHHLRDCLEEFKAAGKLIIGICNGLQILVKSGVLLPDRADEPIATLTLNESGKFEDRWVYLRVASDKCVFLRGIEQMYLPIAHAEGKFVARDADTLNRLDAAGQLVLRYTAAPDCLHSAIPDSALRIALPRQPQRRPAQRRRPLRRNRPRLRPDAASRAAHRPDPASPLDPRAARARRRTRRV